MKKLFTTLIICIAILATAAGCSSSSQGSSNSANPTITQNVQTTVTPQPTYTPKRVTDYIIQVGDESIRTGWRYATEGDNIVIYAYAGTETEVVIPSEIDGKPVHIIDEIGLCYDSKRVVDGSSYHSNITKLTIPASLKEIPLDLFAQCTELKEIVIEDGADFKIENGVLYNKDMSILYYNLNKQIKAFTVPSSVKQIGGGAFRECRELTSITIPEGVEQVGGYAFKNCTSLKTVTVSEGVLYISNYVFSGCKNIEQISLPKTLRTLGEGALTFTDKLKIYVTEGSPVDLYFKEQDRASEDSQSTAKFKDYVVY